MTQWYGAHVYTYILLNESNDILALSGKFPAFYEKYMKQTFDDLNGTASVIFQPLPQIHLDPEYVWEPHPHGSATNVSMLRIIMVFLLVIAAINYVNLATARSAERAGEVGIRKTLGSRRRLLLLQFMGESILTALFSGLLALILVIVLLPYFNTLSGLELALSAVLTIKNIAALSILSLGLGILAGIYPAFYLLSFKPVDVLKGKFATSNQGESLRKILVVTQYCISAVLISGILFVSEQTRFIKNKDIGYDRLNLIRVTVPADTVVSRHLDTYSERLESGKLIHGVTRMGYALNQEANHFTPTLQHPDGTRFQTGADFITVDYDFIETLGAEMMAGRNFDRASGTDADAAFIINETAMKKFGWEQNPLGGRFIDEFQDSATVYNVIGVVKDFNLGASYQEVHPMMIFLAPNGGPHLYVRISGEDIFGSVDEARRVWDELFHSYPFEYTFLDQELAALYEKEEKFLQLLSAFSVIIIFITCLGIVGLISFTAELKKKEIAIRKVNGSPVAGIIMLLSGKFLLLLLIANAIAIPLSWYFIDLWLNNFAYHIDMSGWPFAAALVVSIFFTAVALVYHIMKAASANPVHALRYE
jgi:putative ABC transport system permease protein